MTARERYTTLAQLRDPYLQRAREFAKLTIPALLPDDGQSGASYLPETYSGLGARLVVNLASHTMNTLMPTGVPFFRFHPNAKALAESGKLEPDKDLSQMLTQVELLIMREIEGLHWRQPTNIALQHLIVTGNALEYMLPDNRVQVYRLDQYVVVRSPSGDDVELVIEEFIHPAALPARMKELATSADNGDANKPIPLYTHLRRSGPTWAVYQEIEGHVVPESQGEFTKTPYRPLRWTPVVGEHYGRSKVEEHRGEFQELQALTKAMIEGGVMASRNIIGVRPNASGGLNLKRRIAEAENGAVLTMNPDDVTMLQFANVPGLEVAHRELVRVSEQLGAAFLLGSAMTRDAERVTKFEIARNAEEIEGSLGGVYSMLAQDILQARLERLILQMQRQGKLPEWPDDVLTPTPTTGLVAIGRERDVERVGAALQFLNGMDPQAFQYVKWPTLLGKIFDGLNLPDAVRSDEEVQQRLQEQMAMEAMAAGGTAAAEAAGAAAAAPPQA